MKAKLVILVAALVISGTATYAWLSSRKHRVPGTPTTELTAIDRIDVFRLDDNRRRSANDYFGEFPVMSKAAVDDVRTRSAMLHFLQPYLNDPNYRPDQTGCAPQFGVAFRLWQRDQYLSITVCLGCELMDIENVPNLRDFSPDRPLLIGMLKQAFPDDQFVQKLSEKEPDENDYNVEHPSRAPLKPH